MRELHQMAAASCVPGSQRSVLGCQCCVKRQTQLYPGQSTQCLRMRELRQKWQPQLCPGQLPLCPRGYQSSVLWQTAVFFPQHLVMCPGLSQLCSEQSQVGFSCVYTHKFM
jgi:hypothetical protein